MQDLTDSEEEDKNIILRSMRPPCDKESTIYKKKLRYYTWATNPSIMSNDLLCYSHVVKQLQNELNSMENSISGWNEKIEKSRYYLNSVLQHLEDKYYSYLHYDTHIKDQYILTTLKHIKSHLWKNDKLSHLLPFAHITHDASSHGGTNVTTAEDSGHGSVQNQTDGLGHGDIEHMEHVEWFSNIQEDLLQILEYLNVLLHEKQHILALYQSTVLNADVIQTGKKSNAKSGTIKEETSTLSLAPGGQAKADRAAKGTTARGYHPPPSGTTASAGDEDMIVYYYTPKAQSNDDHSVRNAVTSLHADAGGESKGNDMDMQVEVDGAPSSHTASSDTTDPVKIKQEKGVTAGTASTGGYSTRRSHTQQRSQNIQSGFTSPSVLFHTVLLIEDQLRQLGTLDDISINITPSSAHTQTNKASQSGNNGVSAARDTRLHSKKKPSSQYKTAFPMCVKFVSHVPRNEPLIVSSCSVTTDQVIGSVLNSSLQTQTMDKINDKLSHLPLSILSEQEHVNRMRDLNCQIHQLKAYESHLNGSTSEYLILIEKNKELISDKEKELEQLNEVVKHIGAHDLNADVNQPRSHALPETLERQLRNEYFNITHVGGTSSGGSSGNNLGLDSSSSGGALSATHGSISDGSLFAGDVSGTGSGARSGGHSRSSNAVAMNNKRRLKLAARRRRM